MTHRWNRIAQLAAIGACCSLAVWISSTSAKDEEASLLVKKPAAATAEGPALPPPAQPSKVVVPPQQPAKPPVVVQPAAPLAIPPAAPTAKRPFMRPAQPRGAATGQLVVQGEPLPAPVGPPMPEAPAADIQVRPTPPIEYDTDHDAREMYRKSGEIQLVMVTQNPADGCYYEIPLCIPGCCTGDPLVKGGRGLLGRGVVEYCWPCGFRAEVKFRQIVGDVKVEYEGD